MNSSTGAPRGVENIKTMKSRGLRSIPRSQNDSYLDLYMLNKEKERLEKELSHSGKRSERASKRLQAIGSRIEKLEKSSLPGDKDKAKEAVGNKAPKKDWKVMSIDY